MTLDEAMASLFGADLDIARQGCVVHGRGGRSAEGPIHVIGVGDHVDLGIEDAIVLARHILHIVKSADDGPILLFVDSGSQRMSRRDELLGLNEYLGHLIKALRLAEQAGHRTVGVLCGGSAAGAFIATALACSVVVGLPGAYPEVMDLPSMARVTKLPLEVLEQKAQTSPVFAPGLDNLVRTGGVTEVWTQDHPFREQFDALMAAWPQDDRRAELGQSRGGRPVAASVQAEIFSLALAHG